MILVVNSESNQASVIQSTSFVSEGIWERNHIQDWVRKNPTVLGEPLLVLTIEFDRFEGSRERLDALALDQRGNLVVVEFKRTSDGGSAELQALRYASMVSATRLDQLVPYYVGYLERHCGETVGANIARERMLTFVDDPEFSELSNRPRIILCAQDFGSELTSSVLWLRGFGLDISCVRITPHQTGNALVIVPTRIIPLPEAETYMVSVRQKEESRQVEEQSRKEPTFPFLLREGVLKAGDVLTLRSNLPSYVQYRENDPTFEAEVTGYGERSKALRWKHDGGLYASSVLAKKIFDPFHPSGRVPGAINGSPHWTLPSGKNLWQADSELRKSRLASSGE